MTFEKELPCISPGHCMAFEELSVCPKNMPIFVLTDSGVTISVNCLVCESRHAKKYITPLDVGWSWAVESTYRKMGPVAE